MQSVIFTTGIVTTGIVLGAMVFFSCVIAPLIFAKLDGNVAGSLIREIFPWYYLFVIALSGLAALAAATLAPGEAIALAAVSLAGVVARQLLMPRINRARDASLAGDPAAMNRFSRLHRLSVWINGAQILVLIIVFARLIPPAA
jgi:hypothetical protein